MDRKVMYERKLDEVVSIGNLTDVMFKKCKEEERHKSTRWKFRFWEKSRNKKSLSKSEPIVQRNGAVIQKRRTRRKRHEFLNWKSVEFSPNGRGVTIIWKISTIFKYLFKKTKKGEHTENATNLYAKVWPLSRSPIRKRRLYLPLPPRSPDTPSTSSRIFAGSPRCSSTPRPSRRTPPEPTSCRIPCTWSTGCGSTCPARGALPPNIFCYTPGRGFYLQRVPGVLCFQSAWVT